MNKEHFIVTLITQQVRKMATELMNISIHSEYEILEKAIKENSTPKIRGDITKAKLKKRGIVLYRSVYDNHIETWVEQRDVIISPKIRFTVNTSFVDFPVNKKAIPNLAQLLDSQRKHNNN